MTDLHLILNHARSFGGFEKITSKSDYEVWTQIATRYADIEMVDSTGERLRFTVDWSSRVAYERRLCWLYNDPEGLAKSGVTGFEFEHAHMCALHFFSKTGSDQTPSTLDPLILRALHEIYLVANLTSPGSFNLYRSYLRDPSLNPLTNPLAQTELELSEYLFRERLA